MKDRFVYYKRRVVDRARSLACLVRGHDDAELTVISPDMLESKPVCLRCLRGLW